MTKTVFVYIQFEVCDPAEYRYVCVLSPGYVTRTPQLTSENVVLLKGDFPTLIW